MKFTFLWCFPFISFSRQKNAHNAVAAGCMIALIRWFRWVNKSIVLHPKWVKISKYTLYTRNIFHCSHSRASAYEISESAMPGWGHYSCIITVGCWKLVKEGHRVFVAKNDSVCDLASLTSLLCFDIKKEKKPEAISCEETTYTMRESEDNHLSLRCERASYLIFFFLFKLDIIAVNEDFVLH